MRTDARGAAAQGCDFLFITGSIHADELHFQGDDVPSEAVARLLRNVDVNLAGFMRHLR